MLTQFLLHVSLSHYTLLLSDVLECFCLAPISVSLFLCFCRDIVQYFIELLSLQMHFNHLSCSILMYWPFNVYDSECESWSLIWSDEKKKEWNLTSMRFSLESNFGSFWLVFFWSHFIVIISLKLFSYVSSFRCHTFLSSDLPNSENRIWFDGKWPNTHAFIHSLTHSQSHTHILMLAAQWWRI